MSSSSGGNASSATATPRGIAIVSGILFWYPLAGVTFQFLHYMIGLRQLGFRVYYIEDSSRNVYDPAQRAIVADPRGNIARVEPLLRAHGFTDAWAYRGAYPGGECFGMTHEQILKLYRSADVLLNVTGSQELRDEHAPIQHKLYLETDPFGCQVQLELNDQRLHGVVDAHDVWFSFGENLGQPDCLAPSDREWLATRQPVALELWNAQQTTPQQTNPARYRTLTTWHNTGKEVSYRGQVYHWTKDREFRRFLSVPARRPQLGFELASDADSSSRAELQARGFHASDALAISSDAAQYQAFICNSRAELSVARDQYVRPNTGWFSDRSACYLAAGRPVILQETGFSKFLPIGRGLFSFRCEDDILAAVDAIESDYAQHCNAARELSREYFAADKVLTSLLARAGL
jgi:hypothetical protein